MEMSKKDGSNTVKICIKSANVTQSNITLNRDDEEPPLLWSEVNKAITDLKNNKSTRIDEVAAELVKNGGGG